MSHSDPCSYFPQTVGLSAYCRTHRLLAGGGSVASGIGISDELRRRSRGSSRDAGCSSMSHPFHRPKCCVLRRLGACIDRIADQSGHDPLDRNVLRPGQLAQTPEEIGGQRDEDLRCRVHGNSQFVVSKTASTHKRADVKRPICARREIFLKPSGSRTSVGAR